MQFTGMNTAAFAEQMKPEALRQIRSSLVLEAVAKAEDIRITDEKVDEEIEKMASSYNMDKEKLKEMMGEYEIEQIRSDLSVQAAVQVIADSAVEVEKAAEEA